VKKTLLGLASVFLFLSSFAQPFGNEWIDYDLEYYRFDIYEEGVYRINFQDFTSAGIPISLVDPDNIQLFSGGVEVPIYLKGVEDGVFNSGDYLEFIGKPNDGSLESTLYENPEDRGNPRYSLFNDTIHYFLTINPGAEGRRFIDANDTNFESYSPQPFFWYKSEVVFSNAYHHQPQLLEQAPFNDPNFRVSLSEYMKGEGWMSPYFGFPPPNSNQPLMAVATRAVTLSTLDAYREGGAPNAEVFTRVVGVSDMGEPGNDHFLQIRAGESQALFVNFQYDGYQINPFEFSLGIEELGEESTVITHTVANNLGVSRDQQAISYSSITYPRLPDLTGLDEIKFQYRLNTAQNKSLFEFQNIEDPNPVIYTEGTNGQRIPLIEEGGLFKGLVANDFGQNQFSCYLITDSSLKSVGPIEPVGNNGFFTNFGQSDIDSAFVIVTESSLLGAAQQYSLYRQGRFSTVVANVDELFDQFGLGVDKSELAIRNFAGYIIQEWPTPPSYLLLLGKSIRTATVGSLGGTRRSAANFSRNLVPSYGYPPSDNLITAGLISESLEPAIRTGRVSARSEEEVFWYLDKLQTFESQPHALWMKNMMHFGGGRNAVEQERFGNYLEVYEIAAEDSSYGANVYTYLKTSTEPVQINTSEEINQLIEQEGVSMMTFFAHAGGEGFDQTIDNPENFNWNGKYPFLLANGCYSGDYHSPGNGSVSESYTILQDKGVIGFLASVELGIEGDLHAFSTEFYRQLSLDNYGSTVGDHVKKTINTVQGAQNILRRYLCHGMGLQGDPAVVVNSFPLPDLFVSEQDVYFTPEDITAEIDSFTVNVVVSNIARGTYRPFNIILEHSTPEGIGDSIYIAVQNGLLYRDTVQFRIGIDPQFGLGLHSFDILVDLPQNQVEELPGFESSNNQVLGKELFISNGGIVPIFPYNYAVVPEENVVLKASTGNPLAEEKTYRIEIDTTDTYNSPVLNTTEITQTGGVVEWQPSISYPDSVVYFWRARETDTEEEIWRESSFQYIPNEEGWGQDNFFQLKNNSFSSTEFNRPDRRLDFFSGTVTLRNTVLGNSTADGNIVVLNANQIEYGACTTAPAIHLVVLEPITFEAWGTDWGGENPQNNFGNDNTGDRDPPCRPRVEYFFIFRQGNPTQMQALADLLNSDIIPDGHYIVLYPIGGARYSGWPEDLYSAFGDLGAQTILTAPPLPGTNPPPVPFSLITRKGDPNFVFELYGQSSSDVLNNVVQIPASGSQGVVSSSKIGPANQWGRASWKLNSIDTQAGDAARVKILGTNALGIESEIAELSFDEFQGEVELSEIISASQFPELRFVAELEDEINTTPAQIDRWHILYDKVPEAAVDAATHFEFKASELVQGEEGFLSVAITNVSDVDMDSLLVYYWIEDEDRNRIDLEYPRQDSLKAGESLIDTIYFETQNLRGRNTLWVEVNPRIDEAGTLDQPEQTHFNNFLQVPFEIKLDSENPLLDVTFDGIHIINGEIVSPRPQILIALKDENPFLLMDEPADTSLFRIFVAEPDGDFERVYFERGNESIMEFIPATDEKNRAKILFNPQFDRDGTYSLLIQASDKSGNAAANVDYRIDFEVINQSTISEVLNYPNPFSTSTRFVFTVTGSQVPDEFKIQIMTISGKVVREILQDEIGPIRIGRNISEYAWDGRDEFGDRLANGVYLYRVFARLNGEDITTRDNGASQYFTKSFGKMVLFR
jgi:hypothetical protein